MTQATCKKALKAAGFKGSIYFRSPKEFGTPVDVGPAIHHLINVLEDDIDKEISDIMYTVDRDRFETVVLYLDKSIKPKKIEFHDYLKELGIKNYTNLQRLAESVGAAYSDCRPDHVRACEYSDYGTGRNLKYLALETCELKDCAPLFKLIGGYNGFDPESSLANLIEVFGEDATVRIAREGSPCIYIMPKRNLWFGFRGKDVKADEFCFDPNMGMFRVWWD